MGSLEIVELKAKLFAPLKIVKETIERFLPLPSKIKQMLLYALDQSGRSSYSSGFPRLIK